MIRLPPPTCHGDRRLHLHLQGRRSDAQPMAAARTEPNQQTTQRAQAPTDPDSGTKVDGLEAQTGAHRGAEAGADTATRRGASGLSILAENALAFSPSLERIYLPPPAGHPHIPPAALDSVQRILLTSLSRHEKAEVVVAEGQALGGTEPVPAPRQAAASTSDQGAVAKATKTNWAAELRQFLLQLQDVTMADWRTMQGQLQLGQDTALCSHRMGLILQQADDTRALCQALTGSLQQASNRVLQDPHRRAAIKPALGNFATYCGYLGEPLSDEAIQQALGRFAEYCSKLGQPLNDLARAAREARERAAASAPEASRAPGGDLLRQMQTRQRTLLAFYRAVIQATLSPL